MGSPIEPNTITHGPLLPEDSLVGMRLSFEEDFVFDHKLKAYSGENQRINTFSSLLSQGVATIDLFNRADVYISLGAMRSNFSYQEPLFGAHVECQTKDELTWGVGSRVVLWQWGNIGLGMQGAYQWADMHLRYGTIDGASFHTKNAKVIYHEWQVGFAASYQIDFFIPYVGIKGTGTKANLFNLDPLVNLGSTELHMRNRTWIGMVLGCTLVAPRTFDLTVEADVFDQLALSLVGNIRF